MYVVKTQKKSRGETVEGTGGGGGSGGGRGGEGGGGLTDLLESSFRAQ